MATKNGQKVNENKKIQLNGINKYHENLNSATTPDPIRIVLFRECRLRDRQLIFDSHYNTKCGQNGAIEENKRTPEDFSYLTEMIFGTTTMKYYDTYYKIHNLSSPDRFIFTQVFSSHNQLRSNTSFNQSNGSFATNTNLQDSFNSISQNVFDGTTNSFSLIQKNNLGTPNSTLTTIDSGFSESNVSSNSSFNPSYGSLTRNRSSTFSSSLNTCGSYLSESDFLKNLLVNRNYSKLGLALIVQKPAYNEVQNRYIQYITIIESILWRLRHYVEIALNSPRLFFSSMLEISVLSAQWLTTELRFWTKTNSEDKGYYYQTLTKILRQKFNSLMFSKNIFFKSNTKDEKFEQFCQTVATLEVKETKFFLSTLLTTVLSHHTGWVATSYYLDELTIDDSYHAVWNQLTNLYGAQGHLTKTSKTVIYGLKKDNIKRVLNFLSYFIRFFTLQRQYVDRSSILEENKIIDDMIASLQNQNISKEPPQSTKITGLTKMKKNFVDLSQMGHFNEDSHLSADHNSLNTMDDELILPAKNTMYKRGISKMKTVGNDLFKLSTVNKDASMNNNEQIIQKPVLFILGDNDKLQNLKRIDNNELHEIKEVMIENIENDLNKFKTKLKVIKFPLPKTKSVGEFLNVLPNEFLPDNNILDGIIPDKIFQGTNQPRQKWRKVLIKDLSLKRSCLFRDQIYENVAILGDTDKWEVQVLSSSRNRMVNNGAYISVDSSPIISNMLDVLVQMWKSNISKEQCTTFMEQYLTEICLKANALTTFLLTTEFCTMDLLLNTMNLNMVDVPLLLSVGANIKPEVLEKYGLTYQ